MLSFCNFLRRFHFGKNDLFTEIGQFTNKITNFLPFENPAIRCGTTGCGVLPFQLEHQLIRRRG